MDHANAYSHSRSRTTSSNVFPAQPQHPPPMLSSHQMPNQQFNRRSPSVSTFSNSSIQPPAAYRTSSNSDLRRSISNRSFGQPQATGYVALLRKQKATVWCDRAQYEDPRLVAQQRAAKMRANLEVSGGNRASGSAGSSSGGRTSTGISATGKVAAKIRHHGKLPVVGYANENHVGVGGVPMRLSATEVEGESSDEEDNGHSSRPHHHRTGSSGRSSVGSGGRRNASYRTSGGTVTGAGTTQGARRWSPGDTPERAGSLVEQPEDAMPIIDDAASSRAQSTHSGSSAERGERGDNVGELGAAPRLASRSLMHSALTREKSVKSPEELRRRGSVDERTATLTSQRLYIANPD
ncbi:hypothetical protein Trco_001300 [Trichoderma cornu-damae]|uniref:Uncharacterized protein n=1 Tax=Trichoderma cornu-damae TaxID=654480 RepID=A0A9P8QX42_9HYPO|nr:hypothetical protein Trco_001300 [Trichoderma cornu-damae]